MLQLSSNHSVDWSSAIFAADALGEPFDDITIQSTRNVFIERALEAAADVLHESAITLTTENVPRVAAVMVGTGKIHVQESVVVGDQGITVTVNVGDIDNEESAYRAMRLVADALDHLDGAHGTMYFGQELKYSLSDVPELLKRELS